METTDYCNYELSLALKKAGFDWECEYYYAQSPEPDNDTMYLSGDPRLPQDYNAPHEDECPFLIPLCSAPSLYAAQKWLREKKEIVVIVDPDWDSEDYCLADYLTGKWYFTVWKDGDRVHCNFDPDAEEEKIWMFDSYEQALSAGIAAALELIEKGE